MTDFDPADTALVHRILDKLQAGETICYLDFPDVPEATFTRVMEAICEQLGGYEVH